MAWHYGRKIGALWADYESRNSWFSSNFGPGDSYQWIKLRDDNFDAVQYMTTLATHAKANDRFVDFEENPPGLVSQIYIW